MDIGLGWHQGDLLGPLPALTLDLNEDTQQHGASIYLAALQKLFEFNVNGRHQDPGIRITVLSGSYFGDIIIWCTFNSLLSY
jgi:hypothetical protein